MNMLIKKSKASNSGEIGTYIKKYGITFILISMIVILSFASETFRTWENVINILNQISINGIIAVGMTMVIVTGGIDLSVGSFVAVSSVTCGAVLNNNPDNIVLAIILSLLICGLGGLFNGFFIAKFNMFPFVVTLATLLVVRGVAYIISDGRSFVLKSEAFKQIGQGKLFGQLPVPIFIFAFVMIIGYLLMAHTKFGRYVYAVGGNMNAAIASGVNVFRVKLFTYFLMSVFTGIAGIILTSRVNAGQPSIGTGYELDAIAASIIGGASFNGGIGKITGTFIGVVIIGVINNGMNLLGVSSYYQQVVKGLIILLAVLLDKLVSQKRAA